MSNTKQKMAIRELEREDDQPAPSIKKKLSEKITDEFEIKTEDSAVLYGISDSDAEYFAGFDPEIPKILDQHESGAKMDDGKVDMSLLRYLPRAMYEICRVMSYGKVKYTPGGFLDVPDALNRYRAARGRHEIKLDLGEVFDKDDWYDTEKGLPFKGKVLHRAQVACNAIFELEIALREEEMANDTEMAESS